MRDMRGLVRARDLKLRGRDEGPFGKAPDDRDLQGERRRGQDTARRRERQSRPDGFPGR